MKEFLISFLFITFSFGNIFAQNCFEEGKSHFEAKDYVAAEHALEKCSAKEQQNTNYQISMGGIKIMLAKYEEAKSYFNNALKMMPANSPYYAYVYSNLGDIAMKNKQTFQAMQLYKNTLKYQPENVNALIGYGLTLEKTDHKDAAAEYYKKALEIDFSNLAARKYLTRLEPDCLSDKEKLQALKDRNLISPEANNFGKEDIVLLKKILKAERGSGIEYLSLKYGDGLPDGVIFVRNPDTFYARKMLTLSGYNMLIEKLSSDAKDLFLSKKVVASDLFSLKDFSGKPIFDEKGLLTEEGLSVYNKALKGKKAYLLPGEKAPVNKEQLSETIKQYLAQGYEEVSRKEFDYVQEQTQCSEQTLVSKLKCRTLEEGKNKHYFVLSRGDTMPPFSVPYMFVTEYRELFGKHNENSGPVYKDTFGEKQRGIGSLCDKSGNMIGML